MRRRQQDVQKETDSGSGLSIAAVSSILIDADSGTVLFENNADEKLPPASVTKVMTMLLIMEAVDSGRISLDDQVTVSEHAAGMGGSQVYWSPERRTRSMNCLPEFPQYPRMMPVSPWRNISAEPKKFS